MHSASISKTFMGESSGRRNNNKKTPSQFAPFLPCIAVSRMNSCPLCVPIPRLFDPRSLCWSGDSNLLKGENFYILGFPLFRTKYLFFCLPSDRDRRALNVAGIIGGNFSGSDLLKKRWDFTINK